MFIKFADTKGKVADGKDSIQPLSLGSALFEDDGIFIVDRHPTQETSQVTADAIISIIKYAVTEMVRKKAPSDETLDVYLPRIHPDMFQEALTQKSIVDISPIVRLHYL
ncbi:GbNV_gp41-like [Fopius arisanus]|uniref:GPRC5C protein n=1 Tax=Fopius arisanus TaxID=64838 RepID=A0A0C9R3U6_9HYME|nr:GbNV_gp41-like [Fopius arisanus]